jgi:hypothetical protein
MNRKRNWYCRETKTHLASCHVVIDSTAGNNARTTISNHQSCIRPKRFLRWTKPPSTDPDESDTPSHLNELKIGKGGGEVWERNQRGTQHNTGGGFHVNMRGATDLIHFSEILTRNVTPNTHLPFNIILFTILHAWKALNCSEIAMVGGRWMAWCRTPLWEKCERLLRDRQSWSARRARHFIRWRTIKVSEYWKNWSACQPTQNLNLWS